jgi:glutamine amidotransferase
MEIAVVDYGMGNLRSVTKALEHVAPNERITLTSDPDVIARADKVVFPGQGAMRDCMRELDERGLRQAVLDATTSKPFFGICVGAQLLFEYSEEGGDTPGLNVLTGAVLRFPAAQMIDAQGAKLKVPHMGWNEVRQTRAHPMWAGIEDGARFYFLHSYFMQTPQAELVMGESEYPFPFTVAEARANIFATQFHPEKSHSAGLQLLRNFVAWDGG